MNYKHTQISYPIIAITLIIGIFFVSIYISALQEAPSYDSGPNFALTAIMVGIVCILASFTSLTVSIDEQYLGVKFGYGIYRRKFLLGDILSVKTVKNHWYYGWGIRVWFWPKMWIYNISGFDAVEIQLKNKKIYRIGTDEPKKLQEAIVQCIV